MCNDAICKTTTKKKWSQSTELATENQNKEKEEVDEARK